MKLFWPGHFDVPKSVTPPSAEIHSSLSASQCNSSLGQTQSVSKKNINFNKPSSSVNMTTDQQQFVLPSREGRATSTSTPATGDIIEVNFRYTALIAMCLGFLFIWSTVVSSVFLKNTIDEKTYMNEPVEIFHNQERIGRVMFQVGQEMLFTVDALVSVQLNLTSATDLLQSVNFTWSLTDNEINSVREEIMPANDLSYLLAAIESKLGLIRYNLSLETEHPLNMISSYKLIFDLTEQVAVDRTSLWTTQRVHDPRWHLLMSFAEIQSAPYSLFIKGMNRRFMELSYGTIYHIGPQLFNYTDAETEMSNYFYYFYSSHELIENAFSWDSRIYHRYIELLKRKHTSIFYANSKYNLYSRATGREYTRFVTDVVAFLLNAKDVLNGSYREVLLSFTLNCNTTFYALIASIYFIVLLACTLFFALFIRNARIKSDASGSAKTVVYSQSSGKSQPLPSLSPLSFITTSQVLNHQHNQHY